MLFRSVSRGRNRYVLSKMRKAVQCEGRALPLVRDLSPGMRTIILTLGISSVIAILFPRQEETDAE